MLKPSVTVTLIVPLAQKAPKGIGQSRSKELVLVRRVAARLDVRALPTTLCGPCNFQQERDRRV